MSTTPIRWPRCALGALGTLVLLIGACSDAGTTADCDDKTNPCPTGQRCNATTRRCEAATGCPATCAEPTPYCDATAGQCVSCAQKACVGSETCNAATGRCDKGPDPCQGITCKPGFTCNPKTRICGPECDIALQDCAAAGDKCSIEGDAAKCMPAGTVSEGQACGVAGGDDCAKGLICASAPGQPATCLPLCNASTCTGCPSGSGCSGLAGSGGQPIEGAGVCMKVPAPCDLVAQDCGTGKRCTLLTACGDAACEAETGTKQIGEVCSPATDDCAAGGICLSMGPACFAFCKTTTDCTSGQQCSPFSEGGSAGHCMGTH